MAEGRKRAINPAEVAPPSPMALAGSKPPVEEAPDPDVEPVGTPTPDVEPVETPTPDVEPVETPARDDEAPEDAAVPKGAEDEPAGEDLPAPPVAAPIVVTSTRRRRAAASRSRRRRSAIAARRVKGVDTSYSAIGARSWSSSGAVPCRTTCTLSENRSAGSISVSVSSARRRTK